MQTEKLAEDNLHRGRLMSAAMRAGAGKKNLSSHRRGHMQTSSNAATKALNAATAKIAASTQNNRDLRFTNGQYIVYPAHGVGQIAGVETQNVVGISVELFVVNFAQEKMVLRVPTAKALSLGMRPLSDRKTTEKALVLISGRARIKRAMWGRRAQEYESKINSGNINLVAEVVRDLYRGENLPEQSYSEKQLYGRALGRFAREIALVHACSIEDAIRDIEKILAARLVPA